MLLGNFGIEGESYRLGADGEVILLTQEAPSDRYPSIGMFASLVCWNYGNQDASRFPSTIPQEYVCLDQERVEKARECRIPEYQYACTIAASRMEDCIAIDTNSIFQRIVLGTEPVEEIWQEIIQEYLDQGLEEMIEEVNRQVRGTGG